MDKIVDIEALKETYRNRRVLITGHTGFKGSWLAAWLLRMGAKVAGYALAPPSDPAHWQLLNLEMASVEGDLRDAEGLTRAVCEWRPEIVFHLAAQPLVRLSYREPVETFSTNVMGTLNLFEACRACDTVRAIVNVTSDKCYENREWVWGYRECDPVGGYDPYSASKGCSELLTASYRQSYFNPDAYGREHETLLASCRAGNVIGGGDWAADRLVPDLMRAAARGESVEIRYPASTRPWQHVLDPLGGYLLVGQRLLGGDTIAATAWNFGPAPEAQLSVESVIQQMQPHWHQVQYHNAGNAPLLHEAGLLALDCSKARASLGWRPIWSVATTFERTVNWYRHYYENNALRTPEDIELYESEWTLRHDHG